MIKIDLEVFQGPFDLLLDLIEKQEIDIWDIPIARIADQYLDYLQKMEELDLAVSSEFLLMAAHLLEIKAKMLLPSPVVPDQDDLEEDPREMLVAQILEYKFFKEAAEHLESRQRDAALLFPICLSKPSGQLQPVFTNPVGNVGVDELAELFQKAMQAYQEATRVRQIRRHVSLRERLVEIRMRLKTAGRLAFSELLGDSSCAQIVASFLAILELVRLGEISAVQTARFGEIYLQYKGSREVRPHDVGRSGTGG